MQEDQSAALDSPVTAISKKPVPYFKAAPNVKEILPILSNMPLSDWLGSLTTFTGFTGTTPVIELTNVSWSEISALLAPSEPAILADKKQGQYVVPCMLEEAELVGNTREAAIRNGQPTIGKMRSKNHVDEAKFVMMDIDGLSKEDVNVGLGKIKQDKITYLSYNSYSQGSAEKLGMHVRIAFPLDRAVNVEEYTQAWHGFDKCYFEGKVGEADASGANMYQQQGTWCAHPNRISEAKVLRKDAGVALADALINIGVEVLAAKGINTKTADTSTAESQENKSKGSFNTEDYPPSDANKIAGACYQIRRFRDTKGANQSETLWRDSIGVIAFCTNGVATAQDWSSGYASYDAAETTRKIANRIQVAPTTCNQFRRTNAIGCAGCTQTCKSPITLGWDDQRKEEFTHAYAAENAVPAAMAGINMKHAFIEKYASVYRLEYSNFIEPSKFRLQHDNKKTLVQIGDQTKLIGVGSAWLGSEHRRQHKDIVMRPAEPIVTHDNCLNEWKGFNISPRQGDVRPFLRLFVRLMPNRAARRYVQKWMAHLIQKPGIKMFVSLAIWSHVEGVGKNLLFEALVIIIGATHAAVIGQNELTGSFNSWANKRILVIGDEVSGNDKRQENDKIKGLITGTAIHINEKFQPEREQPNLLNFIFLSNHHDAMFVNDHDRRFFVWEVVAGQMPSKQVKDFVNWRDSGGLEALHHFLLHFDISDFSPRAPAPMTEAKQQMVNDNRSDLEAWLADVMVSNVTKIFGSELVTSSDIGRFYAISTGHKAPSSKAIVGACKRLGSFAYPTQIRFPSGHKLRALTLTRHDFWKTQSEAAWAVEMEKLIKLLD